MRPKTIRNLKELRFERELLQQKLDMQEEKLTQSWSYLQRNYKGLVWNEINPFKNSSALKVVLGLIQPGLLPVIAEVAKGTANGKPINLKVIGSAAKYALASLGINWLRKWLDVKEGEETESLTDREMESNQNNPI